MTQPLVTVLMPTFDHVDTLRYSIPTVLSQTHAPLELFVIGDGAPDGTREIVEEFARSDDRVRYIGFDKGSRNGEAHRHGVLMNEARGDHVMYIGDDDLWLPTHVETMLGTFAATGANFVSCQPCWILPGDEADRRWIIDLSNDWFHRELQEGRNRIPLSCGAHTMDLYRQLPHGWRTTPRGTPTDLYMWQQILAFEGCRAASTPHTTVIGLPDSQRRASTADDRLAELAAWSPTTDPTIRERFLVASQAADSGLLRTAFYEAEYDIAMGVLRDVEADLERHREYVAILLAEAEAADAEVAKLRAALEHRERQLHTVLSSRGWRLLERVRRRFRRGGAR